MGFYACFVGIHSLLRGGASLTDCRSAYTLTSATFRYRKSQFPQSSYHFDSAVLRLYAAHCFGRSASMRESVEASQSWTNSNLLAVLVFSCLSRIC